MQNWSGDENEAMKGYILLAVKRYNADCRAEYGFNAIEENTYDALMRYLYRATDDMTADEAQRYYLNHEFNK